MMDSKKPKTRKNVTVRESPSTHNSNLEDTQSQTDASEWVEYETDMKELVENLKDEGIDVPIDEQGNPILSADFIKNLPPSVQPHAGGKLYGGRKPFKSTLDEPAPKGALDRQNQTRTSIWEEYKKELNALYKKLEKNGIPVPRDEDGIPIYNEDLVKTLPPEQIPHPAGPDFTPIRGLPPLADGTRVSPRLTMRLITPAIELELYKMCKKMGVPIPQLEGKPTITSEFLRSIPPDLLETVFKPIYENQQKLSEKRVSAIRKLSLEKKNSLKNLLVKKGIEVKSTKKGEPIIPMITVMQFTEEEISQVVGEEDSRDIFKPAPLKRKSLPEDTITHLSTERRNTLGAILHEKGLPVDVDEKNIPIITKTNASFLTKDILDKFNIALEDIMKPSTLDVRKIIFEVKDGDKIEKTRTSKDSEADNIPGSSRKSRKNLSFKAGRGVFNLTQNSAREQLTKRLTSAGADIKMTQDGELELSQDPDAIVQEFTSTIEEELKNINPEEMHHRIFEMLGDERQLIQDHLQWAGIDVPVDETGNKLITVEFLEKLPRDVVINLLAKLFVSPHGKDARRVHEEEEEEYDKENDDNRGIKRSLSGKIETMSEHDDIELELTDDQREEFYDRLMDEGIRAPIDEVTGRPRFTREFIRTVPKKIAREIIMASTINNDESTMRLSDISEDSDEEEEDTGQKPRRLTKDETVVQKKEDIILGLRFSPNGVRYVTDDKGHRLDYDTIVSLLKKPYSDSDLKRHDEYNCEKEASLRAAIREERRHEDKDPEIKRAGSDVEMQQMAMRFIPEYNPQPEKTDPIDLFEHIHRPSTVPPSAPSKGVEFVHILEPTFQVGRVDSLATVPSTVARKFSNDSVRGSVISTRLSDMPSMFSQALIEDPSTVYISASSQEFDITPESVSDYRQKWLSSFMSGYTPKQTFTICIINMITRKKIELRVCKENTLNEVCHMYMQYEDHPEYYVWKDIYGKLLIPEKNLVENGLLRKDEVLEFQGYRRLPVLLLYFRDGFENDPPLPLNPLHALKQREPGLCRNY